MDSKENIGKEEVPVPARADFGSSPMKSMPILSDGIPIMGRGIRDPSVWRAVRWH